MASAAGVHGPLLDLVCGPASPLPETYQRYRLVAHLGSGGQAEVYRAVRLCGGVTSAPMTVKVFRIDPRRPLVDELRSWDKGDAALMDLNNRGVTGICRRADGFYGPPPHKPGERPNHSDAVPYQIYDYLHGINLRQYVAQQAGVAGGAGQAGAAGEPGSRRLNAIGALRTLAGVLRALHHPGEVGATPVLHMDVKPSNVMVLTNGQVRLIDFTGARYWRREEITQIAYTPEAGGPEAFGGVSQVSPAYDVHGFGAVAYYLVTGAYPRVDSSRSAQAGRPLDGPPPPWSVLRKNPMLESLPALRDHLHAPVADRPGDRPSTLDLPGWVDRLSELVRQARVPDIGVDWHEPAAAESPRIVARATVAGTETGAFQRIERLERELVELRAAVNSPASPAGAGRAGTAAGAGVAGAGAAAGASAGGGTGAGAGAGRAGGAGNGPLWPTAAYGAATALASPQVPPPANPAKTRVAQQTRVAEPERASPSSAGSGAGSGAGSSGAAGGQIRGRASVPTPKPAERSEDLAEPLSIAQPSWRQPARDQMRSLKRGWELSGTGAIFAFVCWGIWAASSRGKLLVPALAFGVVLAVAVGVFAICRLLGRMVLVQRMGRTRRGATLSHAITGLFLAAAGVAYLRQTEWVVKAYQWLHDLAG